MNQENETKSLEVQKDAPTKLSLILTDLEKATVERFFGGSWELTNPAEINRAKDITPRVKAAICEDPRFHELMYTWLFNGAFGLRDMTTAMLECGKLLMRKSDFMPPLPVGRPTKQAGDTVEKKVNIEQMVVQAQPHGRSVKAKVVVPKFTGYSVDEDDQ